MNKEGGKMAIWCDNSCFDASHGCKRMSWCECEKGMSEPKVNIKKKIENEKPVSKKIENNNNLIEISINGKMIKGTKENIKKLLE